MKSPFRLSIVAIFAGGLFLTTGTCQQFNQTIFHDIDFVDSLNGWFVGGTLVVHTPDAGQTWRINDVGIDISLDAVEFISATKGWVGGQVCCDVRGIILHTTDGGKSWEIQHEDTNGDFRAIEFVDEKHGWAGGQYSGILYTDDGGENWIRGEPELRSGFILSISFIDSLIGFADGYSGYGLSGLRLINTRDGGKTWTADSSLLNVATEVFFVDSLRGWDTGPGGIYRTVDGGQTWVFSPPPWGEGWSVHDIFFVDSMVGYVSMEIGTYRTDDGGLSWQLISDKSGEAIFFTGRDVGWGVWVATGGFAAKRIARTMDGGKTWENIVVTSVEDHAEYGNTTPIVTVHPSFPNPFNSGTTIEFQLPEAGDASVKVYDLHGRTIRILANRKFQAGSHRLVWDGREDSGTVMPSGIYLYELKAGAFSKVMKMTLLK